MVPYLKNHHSRLEQPRPHSKPRTNNKFVPVRVVNPRAKWEWLPSVNIATPRNTYTPISKKRYAHTIGGLPERNLLCTLPRCQRPNLLRRVLPTRKNTKHRRAQRVLKKTLRIPLGRRGARPRSGRFLEMFFLEEILFRNVFSRRNNF